MRRQTGRGNATHRAPAGAVSASSGSGDASSSRTSVAHPMLPEALRRPQQRGEASHDGHEGDHRQRRVSWGSFPPTSVLATGGPTTITANVPLPGVPAAAFRSASGTGRPHARTAPPADGGATRRAAPEADPRRVRVGRSRRAFPIPQELRAPPSPPLPATASARRRAFPRRPCACQRRDAGASLQSERRPVRSPGGEAGAGCAARVPRGRVAGVRLRGLAGNGASSGGRWRDLQTINLRNGLLDCANGRAAPARPRFPVDDQRPVPFEREAAAPTWERFLGQVLPPDLQELRQEWCLSRRLARSAGSARRPCAWRSRAAATARALTPLVWRGRSAAAVRSAITTRRWRRSSPGWRPRPLPSRPPRASARRPTPPRPHRSSRTAPQHRAPRGRVSPASGRRGERCHVAPGRRGDRARRPHMAARSVAVAVTPGR